MFVLFHLLLSFLLLVALSLPARAHETLNIAVGDWPPYLSLEQQHGGVIAHMLSDIFAAEDYRLNITVLPWGRAYDEARQGRHHMTGVWMHKQEREANFYYSDAVLTEQFVFFHLQERPFTWQKLADLKGLSIGGDLKYSYGAAFDAALEAGSLDMQRVVEVKQNFGKLLLQRLDIYPQELNVGYANLKKHFTPTDITRITHHPKPLLNNLSYVLFPKTLPRSKALLEKFNRRLHQFKQSGRYQRYFDAFKQGDYEL